MTTKLRDDDYFGLCPKCHKQGMNFHENRADHWSVCQKHKLKWYTGALMSFPYDDATGEMSWERGEKILKHNRFVLASCQEVEPFYWPQNSPMSYAYQIEASKASEK